MKNFSLPVANVQVATQSQSYSLTIISTWLVAMMGNGSSCLKYLKDLFTATKTFYHPSNTGDFQQDLVSFLAKLSQAFIDRVHLYVELKFDYIFVNEFILENENLILSGILIHLNHIDLQKMISPILLIVSKNVSSSLCLIKHILKKQLKHVNHYHNFDQN